MKTAGEISKAYAEYKSLLYLRDDAKKFGAKHDRSTCLSVEFACGGASGVWHTVSDAMIKEVTADAYRKAIDRAIKNIEKRFRDAGVPIE